MADIATLLNRVTFEYVQEPDCNDSESGSVQQLSITVEPVLFKLYDEKTGGKDYYFHIKTERWAFDDIDELIDILKEVKSKVSKNEKI